MWGYDYYCFSYRYEGPLLQEEHLEKCIIEGVESLEFIHFVTWLSNDISKLLKLEESITTGLGEICLDVLISPIIPIVTLLSFNCKIMHDAKIFSSLNSTIKTK